MPVESKSSSQPKASGPNVPAPETEEPASEAVGDAMKIPEFLKYLAVKMEKSPTFLDKFNSKFEDNLIETVKDLKILGIDDYK